MNGFGAIEFNQNRLSRTPRVYPTHCNDIDWTQFRLLGHLELILHIAILQGTIQSPVYTAVGQKLQRNDSLHAIIICRFNWRMNEHWIQSVETWSGHQLLEDPPIPLPPPVEHHRLLILCCTMTSNSLCFLGSDCGPCDPSKDMGWLSWIPSKLFPQCGHHRNNSMMQWGGW